MTGESVPAGQITEEFEEKRSRFIGRLVAAGSEKEFHAALGLLKQEHPKARHIAWAFRFSSDNGQLPAEGFSDDGEPSGTAGMPLLKQLRHYRLINGAVFAVRYFGGIKLGTGGLQRAYGQCARSVLSSDHALMPYIPFSDITIETSFQADGVVRSLIDQAGGEILSADYTATGVRLNCALPDSEWPAVQAALPDEAIVR
ncbi:MAG: YigZ family protein [Pseudomonadota bacterium]|nr:YigZ family protein [Pseudomonadota bacterium]